MENKTIKYTNNIETTSEYDKTKDKNKESSVIIRGTTIGFFIEYFFNEISYCHFFNPPLPSNTDIRRQNQNQLLPPMMVIYLLRKSFLFISQKTRYPTKNITHTDTNYGRIKTKSTVFYFVKPYNIIKKAG